MMEIKLFEVLDRGTAIPVLAVRIVATKGDEDYILRRAGYGAGQPCILVTNLARNETHYDLYEWSQANGRTMREAHAAIEAGWSTLNCGDVVDVEFILGETVEPKPSERGQSWPSS